MPVEHESAAAPERYRRSRQPCSPELGGELTDLSGEIVDPVMKLRYLRSVLDTPQNYQRRVEHLPYGRARRLLYRLRGLNVLEAAVDHNEVALTPEARARIGASQRSTRRAVAAGIAVVSLTIPALLVGLALQIGPSETATANAKLPVPGSALSTALPVVPSTEPVDEKPLELGPATVVAETLPDDALGLAPTTIWLADRGPGWELFSNGLRIETTYAVAGEQRRYRVHDRKLGLQPAVFTRPVGVLFHTSESDLWPLSADYERQLRRSSANLLRYVQKTKAYNYLIDRFGRVYRVVDDETRASHAGHSVWANGDDVYLDLNSAFLGVSFESRWEGGRTLPITRAQLIAGRNLTNYLRQRFAIAPEMCVTHGLTSVSPRQHLIGYHRDWARGFPFAAFGLPDLYAQPLPSVALFGFEYDMEFVRAIGEPWAGLTAAERMLAQTAKERGVSVGAVRQERRTLYGQWLKQVRDSDAPASESAASIEKPATRSETPRVSSQRISFAPANARHSDAHFAAGSNELLAPFVDPSTFRGADALAHASPFVHQRRG